MKHALPARKEMGIRTAFNILGPLSNPAGADYQIVGVFDGGITGKVAAVLSRLGVERAMVVHGFDGLDEITLTGPTKVSELRDGWIRDYELDPAELGLSYCEPDALKGGELKTNCKIALSILHGERSPRRDIVLLNSAAAIYTSGASGSMKSALDIAATSIDTGAAMKKLEQLIQYTGD